MIIRYFLFLSILLFISCSPARKQSTTFSISIGNLVTNDFSGGVYVWAKNLDTGETIKSPLETDYTMTVPNGNWRFHFLAFLGPGEWSGLKYCGSSGVLSLDEPTETYGVSVTRSACDAEVIFHEMVREKLSQILLPETVPAKDFINLPQNLSNFKSIGNKEVKHVFTDSNGNLLVSTELGLSISNDYGRTFTTRTVSNGLRQNFVINAVKTSSGTVFVGNGAGIFNRGLSRSRDGGKTFQNALGDQVWGLFVDRNDRIYAALNTSGLRVSSDNGDTWSQFTTANGMSSNSPRAVFVDGAGVIYTGGNGGLDISTDGGTSFVTRTTADGLGSNTFSSIAVSESGVIWVATSNGLSKSTDGGVSFVNFQTTNGLASNTVNSVSISKSGVVFIATQSGVSFTNDGGATFVNRSVSHGLGNSQVNWVEVDDFGNVYAATRAGLSISKDGGISFKNIMSEGTPRTRTCNAVAIGPSGEIYVDAQGVWKSTDKGESFTYVTNQGTRDIFFGPSGKLLLSTISSGLYISNDGGQTFQPRNTSNGLGSNFTNAAFEDSSGNIYVATNSGLSISTDGGGTFVNRTTANGLGDNYVHGVVVDSSGTIYAATNAGGLAISTDGGGSFISKTTADGLPADSLDDIAIDSSDNLYIAARAGGFSISTDGGTSFTNYPGNTSSINVNQNGVISTAGSFGIKVSFDGGSSFSSFNDTHGLGVKNVYEVVVDGDGNIYAATYGGGLSASSSLWR